MPVIFRIERVQESKAISSHQTCLRISEEIRHAIMQHCFFGFTIVLLCNPAWGKTVSKVWNNFLCVFVGSLIVRKAALLCYHGEHFLQAHLTKHNTTIAILTCATTLRWLFGSRCELFANSSPELCDFCRCIIHNMLRLPFLRYFGISAAK